MQLPLLVPTSSWRPPRLSDLPQNWNTCSRIAIDVETCDPQLKTLGPGVRRGGYIAGYSFAFEDGPKFYIPLRHGGGDNMESTELALQYLRDQMQVYAGEIVGANLGYDLDYLWHAGIKMPVVKKFRDVQVAESLLDELLDSYSLEAICNRHLGIGKDEKMLREAARDYQLDAKADLHKLPARYVGEYAEADAHLPLLVLRRQEKQLDEQGLWNVWDLESNLLPVLVRMRQRGVRIDLTKLEIVERWSADQERLVLGELEKLTGCRVPFNAIWEGAALVPVLEQIGVQIPLTPKTKKPSIKADFLKSIDHPAAALLLRARKVNKVRTTFCNSLRNHAVGDRIHCTYNQLRGSSQDDQDGDDDVAGAGYGRVSCQNPNLQQQPSKDPEIAPMWRDVYIPDEGGEWCSADYSQQEPRMAVHYAVRTKLGKIKLYTGGERHEVDGDASALMAAERYRNDPSMDNHQMMAEMASIERKPAKEIFLGLCYGMGGPKLCRKLELPVIKAVRDPMTRKIHEVSSSEGQRLIKRGERIFETAGEEGQKLLDKFDLAVPFVRGTAKKCTQGASARGYVRTLSGRKCRFPRDEHGNWDWTHKAFNRVIQGSSGDQTKMAMVEIDRAGIPLQLQVHDEIDLTIWSRKTAQDMVEIMLSCTPLEVPSKVDLEIGPSWGKAK